MAVYVLFEKLLHIYYRRILKAFKLCFICYTAIELANYLYKKLQGIGGKKELNILVKNKFLNKPSDK